MSFEFAPITAPIQIHPVGAALTAAGTALSVYGQMQSAKGFEAMGEAQMRSAEFNKSIRDRNARLAEREADLRERVGGREEVRFRKKFAKLQAQTETAFRKAGVVATTGTPLQVLMENASEGEEEVQLIKLETAGDATRLREQATNQRLAGTVALLEGGQQRMASNIRAGTARLQALSDIFSAGAQLV